MMKSIIHLAVVSALVIATVFGAVTEDEVKSLPGWDGPLPSKHYSGYMPVHNGDGFLHYWFIESQNNPATDPVALWLNGGPGSSSLIGLLTENGQVQTNDDSETNGTAGPKLLYNKYNWSLNTSVIYLESPKGVGFSYCKEGVECLNTDEITAEDNCDFLIEFFKNGFPEYANNDFYITGESYAGTYIPMLMDQIDKRGGVNLKGAAIGDGCWGNEVGTCGFASQSMAISVEFYNGHAMIPQTLYNSIKETCGNFSSMSADCHKLIEKLQTSIGDFDIYNIYDDCGSDQYSWLDKLKMLRQKEFYVPSEDSHLIHPQLNGGLNDYVCGAMKYMQQWISQDSVAEALHVKQNTKGMTYKRTVADLRPLYKTLAQKYRIVIYSGDVDACVPYWGSEQWTRELGFPVKEEWRPWHSGSTDEPQQKTQKAGYVVTYQSAPDMVFTFMTVQGSGHLVPQHQPVRALAMVSRFFNNEEF